MKGKDFGEKGKDSGWMGKDYGWHGIDGGRWAWEEASTEDREARREAGGNAVLHCTGGC